MSHTLEMSSRSWSAPVAPIAMPSYGRRTERSQALEWDTTARGRGSTGGVLLRWGAIIPMPRGPHTQRAPVQPPQLWCVEQEHGIAPGCTVYLLHTGQAPGLVARGVVLRPPFVAARADRIGTVGQHITVEWIEVLTAASRIPLDILHIAVPDGQWFGVDPAMVLRADVTERVDRVWQQWHHKPQRRHHVDWDRAGPTETASVAARTGAVPERHRHSALAGAHPRPSGRHVG